MYCVHSSDFCSEDISEDSIFVEKKVLQQCKTEAIYKLQYVNIGAPWNGLRA